MASLRGSSHQGCMQNLPTTAGRVSAVRDMRERVQEWHCGRSVLNGSRNRRRSLRSHCGFAAGAPVPASAARTCGGVEERLIRAPRAAGTLCQASDCGKRPGAARPGLSRPTIACRTFRAVPAVLRRSESDTRVQIGAGVARSRETNAAALRTQKARATVETAALARTRLVGGGGAGGAEGAACARCVAAGAAVGWRRGTGKAIGATRAIGALVGAGEVCCR